MSLAALRKEIALESAVVYAYVVTSVEHRSGRLIQTGSGPNWQGGVLTLCTCKHRLRSFLTPEQWPGIWLAGFTITTQTGENALVFLTRIAAAFPSQAALWRSDLLSPTAKRAKSARRSIDGDLYEPREGNRDEFNYRSYYSPCPDHSHAADNSWRSDIRYVGEGGRQSAMLVGDRRRTFLWDQPLLYRLDSIGRGARKLDLAELLKQLR